ncbi:MAG: hypothetical protein ABSB84_02225 [Verrucomicrobiota bacterium]|jgi:hypothetical protein
MPGTDPNPIRQAVAQFQPRRRPRFQNLLPWQDVVVELRGKGASCEAIAELLTRHGVKTSRTMVNEFVWTLYQPNGNRRSKPRLKPATASAVPPSTQPLATLTPHPEPLRVQNPPVKSRGPHIAKIELVKPGENYD